MEFTEITKGMSDQVNKMMEQALSERLEELSIPINLEEEKNRRFKSLISEVQGNIQTIYYNDGSISGLKVISFETITDLFTISLKIIK